MIRRKSMLVAAAAAGTALLAVGCWNPFAKKTPPPTTVTVVNPLRTANVSKPSLYEPVTFNLSTRPCNCPEGYVRLHTQAYWSYDEPTDRFQFAVYMPARREGFFGKSRSAEVLSPRSQSDDNTFELLPGVYDIAVTPDLGVRSEQDVIWVRGLNLTQPGMEYDLDMQLHGAMIKIKNADRYRVYSGGTKARYLDGGTVDALPVSRLYTQSSRDFEFPVPAGTYDIYLIRSGESPVWIENFRPQPSQVNVIDVENLPTQLGTSGAREEPSGRERSQDRRSRQNQTADTRAQQDGDNRNWDRYDNRNRSGNGY